MDDFESVFGPRTLTYDVRSKSDSDRIYKVTIDIDNKKLLYCNCQGWLVHKKCYHAALIKKEKLDVGPIERERQRREAQKHGKAIAPVVNRHEAYNSVEHKLKNNKELSLFLEQVS